MKYTIGLDIGIASIGWAVINNDMDRIENLGVLTFKKAEEADGKSLNLARREARGTRRRLRRRAIRMKKVKELMINFNLISQKELDNLYILTPEDKSVWELRKIGLEKVLDRKEWARVLTSIAKRRGYKSNRRIDTNDKEIGKLSKGTIENKKILEEKGYKTIGEMFYKDPKFKDYKRNKSGEYNNTILRSMLIDEVNILFETQRKLGNKYTDKEFQKQYIDIVTYQKPYTIPQPGKCTFEKNELRAPKNSYTFERFMLLQKINNLTIYDEHGEQIKITNEQREKIINMAYEKTEVKYTQLRKELNLTEKMKFTNLNYNQSKKNAKLS